MFVVEAHFRLWYASEWWKKFQITYVFAENGLNSLQSGNVVSKYPKEKEKQTAFVKSFRLSYSKYLAAQHAGGGCWEVCVTTTR